MNRRPSHHRLRTPLAASFLFCAAAALAQTATPAADASAKEDEAIILSPFEVVADTKGYYSANTMSGTRFNTKLQDLGASVSVMTTEQMHDFAMTDLNDVFLYMAGVEGTGTYSDFVTNRNGEVLDNVSMNPTQANRIRGISAANISYGNFETMARTPLDPLVLEGVEVNRGPNANVFGLGNPSGTVNQVPVSANLTRDRMTVEARVDDWDGHRASVDVNKVVLKHKLALRFSALDQEEGFVRKPSGIDTRRYNGMIRFQPFKNTTINASYLYYESEGRRPNYATPRDFASYWFESGKPGWDPVRQMIVKADGTTYGPFVNDNFLNTDIGYALQRSGGQFQRSNVFVDRDGITYWTTPTNNTGTTPAANTGTGANFIRLLGSSPGPGGATGKFTNQPLFKAVPGVSNKDIYDYENINLASPDYRWDESETYLVTLDQLFLNTPTQTLAAQLGFFREDADRYQQFPVGNAGGGGQNGQLWVDVNKFNLDGSVNPNFGRTYIGVGEPVYSYYPEKWDTYRGQLAYRYDFTQSDRWTKWLGTHQLTGYSEYKYRLARKYSYRDTITSDHPWLAEGQPGVVGNFARANQANITGGPQAGPNIIREFYRFYVGDDQGGDIDYAPGQIIPGTYDFVWGTTGNWRHEKTTLGQLATTNNTGGPNNLKRIIKTNGGVIQSHWLDGKFVSTFGLRQDLVYAKQGMTPQQLLNNNTEHDFKQINSWEPDYRYSSGKTKTMQFVARPFRDLGFVNRWAQGTGFTRFFGTLLRDSAITYNKSDNFIPAPPAIDLFLNPLPNQTGEGEDIGVWLNMFDNKLVVRVNHYDNTQINARDGDANTIAQRVLRLEFYANDRHQLFNRARDWHLLQNPAAPVGQAEDSALQLMKLSRGQFDLLLDNANAGTLAATNDIQAKGTEIEINYNPTSYWTISANGEEKRSINQNVSSTVQDWIDLRMPIWTSVVDPISDPNMILGTDRNTQGWATDATNPNRLWWLHRYGGGSQSPAENFAVNVEAPWSVIRETEGKARPQVRRYAARLSTNFRLEGITSHKLLKKFSVGGAFRWEDKGAIGYYGVADSQGIYRSLDANRPIWSDATTDIDAFITYRTKLFHDRVGATFRLNVRNLTRGGELQPTDALPDGTPLTFRIIDPRQFILTASFDL
ncbi:TonB-dependent receptor plug domain-containing protein [Opitutus terrae]|uniref:TonB-dependent receptor plug n=1 Tax=Opitutus terrae (strain DSM 11246 / JCM 15787 / PB90-1) TaxID=452637 RepID=B1ZP71_OPITP|nr:TonB-dependent receptor plug domain-containing protein [Opitutus terrae]ACB77560.1 TonB-dependent receptor plug [Opitutus terrae PB90-1]